jgi:hypothetical protein
MFQPFMTGSNELEGQVTGKLAYLTLLLSCRSLSALASSVFHLSGAECLYALWNETLLHSLDVFYASNTHFIKNQPSRFLRLF